MGFAAAAASSTPLAGATITNPPSCLLIPASFAFLAYEVTGLHLLRSTWTHLDRIPARP